MSREVQVDGVTIVQYPERFLKMTTLDGFAEMFYQKTQEYNTYEEAYEACEVIYEKIFLSRKYSNYASFRQVLKRKTTHKGK